MKLFHRVFRTRPFLRFSREFFRIASEIRSVLISLILLIALGGWALSKLESLDFRDGQYLAFVTALTIGYGDLSPESYPGKLICILLGVVGMVWIGLIVGVASVAVGSIVKTQIPEDKKQGKLKTD